MQMTAQLFCWFLMLYILWFPDGTNSDESVIYTVFTEVRSTSLI